jgi:hypothetical protein
MIAQLRVRVGEYKVDRRYMFKDLVIGLQRILGLIHKLSLYVLYPLHWKWADDR